MRKCTDVDKKSYTTAVKVSRLLEYWCIMVHFVD